MLQGNLPWQQAMATAIRDPEALIEALGLPAHYISQARQAAQQFPLRLPHSYLSRIEYGNPNDPLLRQILPITDELEISESDCLDPVGDLEAQIMPGLIQKYRGRLLWMATAACPIHCRYCFRRHYPYSENTLKGDEMERAIEHISGDTSISELILSGGDPLTLSNDQLAALCNRISTIPHLKRLRIHTRFPIVLPQRVDPELCQLLTELPLQTILVLHCNHAQEINQEVGEALQQLNNTGATLFNQSVLLRGVNDNLNALQRLSESLFEQGIMPYYLHMLDPVQGASHFDVSTERAQHLLEGLQERLPGYLVPKLVKEVTGMAYKQPIISS